MWSALAHGSARGSAGALKNKKRRLVTDTLASLRRTAHLSRTAMSLRMLVPNPGSPSIEIRTPRPQKASKRDLSFTTRL